MKFDGTSATIKVDNLYFGAPVSPVSAAPEPTAPAAHVLSILGTTYGTDSSLSSGINVVPEWGPEYFCGIH